ncbi:MAG TPA: 2-hydroxyacid dehydrogenase [Patescibacteria group bacterium]|nr:2-hydroxyacid dehydrogenase [Patescibacteria group bacterium]
MRFKKILVVGIGKGSLTKETWGKIDRLTEKKVLLPADSKDIQKHLSTTDCLLVSLGITVDKKIIDHAPKLKYIGALSTGYGRIDDAYTAKKRIVVCNIPGYSTEAVTEFAFAAILEHLREVERGKNQARKGDYSEATFFGVSEIKGKKFGVIGLGQIGGRIAEIAHDGFGADVRYWSRIRKKKYERKGIKYQEVESLIKECDFLSLNLAYNKDTENFLNSKRIGLIKSGAVVINLAPMELLDIKALEKRLKKGDITFILDHSDELSPAIAKRLSKYKNCILYPPIAYTTKEATAAKQEIFVQNLENFLKGKPTNKVN